MVKAFLPAMLERNHGHIINMASISAFVSFPGLSDYSASKHAISGANDHNLFRHNELFSRMPDTYLLQYMCVQGLCSLRVQP